MQSSWSGAQYAVPAAAGTPVLGLKAWMTEEASRKLAAAGGQDLDALRKAAVTRGAKAVDLGVSVEGALQQTVARKMSPNVIGVLEGTNAGRSAGAGESVIYSAHYDHIGIKPVKDEKGDAIYNGARDNASGVAAILEIAEAFVATGRRPARSIYFIATTGEESGLLGSEYFATHPTMAIDKVAANINIDALNVYGTTPEIVLLGVERSDLRVAVDDAVKRWGRRLGQDEHPERGYFYRSDHFPLAKVGVPAVSITLANVSTFNGPNAERARKLATSYNETCYHQACDEFSADWDLTGAVAGSATARRSRMARRRVEADAALQPGRTVRAPPQRARNHHRRRRRVNSSAHCSAARCPSHRVRERGASNRPPLAVRVRAS